MKYNKTKDYCQLRPTRVFLENSSSRSIYMFFTLHINYKDLRLKIAFNHLEGFLVSYSEIHFEYCSLIDCMNDSIKLDLRGGVLYVKNINCIYIMLIKYSYWNSRSRLIIYL